MHRPRFGLTFLLAAIAVALISIHGHAQSAPAFEVASIKPNTSGLPGSRTNGRGNSFIATNTVARFLVIVAFNLKDFQLIGGPDWITSERFDINARTPDGVNYSRDMLRRLLEERFKLVTHTETREQQVYALVLARADGRLGPQIKPTTTLDCTPTRDANPSGPATSRCSFNASTSDTVGKLTAVAQPIEGLAMMLGNFGVGRQVIDRTGLAGKYDFELQWSPDTLRTSADTPGAAPGLFTALQEQLGLKLESARGPVETVVIDSIERPTPD